METNTVAGPEASTAASTPTTKLSEADMAMLQNMIGAALGASIAANAAAVAAKSSAAVPVTAPSLGVVALFEKAKLLSGSMPRAELEKLLNASSVKVDTLEKERGNLVATLDIVAKEVAIDAAKNEAVVIHMALDLLAANDTNADTLYNRAVKLLGKAGIVVKKPASSLTLSEQRNANKSFLSRLF